MRFGVLLVLSSIAMGLQAQSIPQQDSLKLELRAFGCGIIPTQEDIGHNLGLFQSWLADESIEDRTWIRYNMAMEYFRLKYLYQVDSAQAEAAKHFQVLCDAPANDHFNYTSCMNLAVMASMDNDCVLVLAALEKVRHKKVKRRDRNLNQEKELKKGCSNAP